MNLQLVCLGLLAVVSAVHARWSYAKQGEDWSRDYPECGGETQSPINIKIADTVDFKNSHPIKFSENIHKKVENATLDNNGFGYKIEFHDKNRFMWSSALPGSPYKLLQVHIHFGTKRGHGSEHQLDGHHYPAETYDDVSTAGQGLTLWLNKLTEVKNEGDKVDVSGLIDLSTIIPLKTKWKMERYFRYEGSLTTPPCNEIVQWTVFQDPIYISSEQYKKLLHGKRKSKRAIMKTYRTPMPLNGRTVYRSSIL